MVRQAEFDGVSWAVEVQHRPRQEPYQRGVGQSLSVVAGFFRVGVFAGRKAGCHRKIADRRRPPGVPAGDFQHHLEQRCVAVLAARSSHQVVLQHQPDDALVQPMGEGRPVGGRLARVVGYWVTAAFRKQAEGLVAGCRASPSMLGQNSRRRNCPNLSLGGKCSTGAIP